MYEINQERQLELLRRLLFAWDGQWFLKSAAAFGPDEALKVNARVRAAYGRLEMKAMLALLGQEKAASLADSLAIIKSYHQIAFSHNPILSGVHLVASGTNGGGRGKALVALNRCVALDNAKRSALPVSPSDSNCIYCQMLWTTWFENLLPDAQIEVVFESQPVQGAAHGILAVTSFHAPTASPVAEAATIPNQNPFMTAPTSYPAGFSVPANPITQPTPASQPLPPQNVPTYSDPATVYPPSLSPNQPANYPPSQSTPTSDPYLNTAYSSNSMPDSYSYPPNEPAPNPYSTSYPPTQQVSYSPEPNYPPATPATPSATPLIGGNEVGANNSRAIAPSGSLRQRLQQNREPNTPTVPNVPSVSNQPVPPPPPVNPDEPMLVPTVHIDPTTGRPLFNGDMERLIETGVKSSKKKSLNLISRVMLSKEAQQLLKESANNPVPPVVPMTLANSIDTILQRLIINEQNERPGSIVGIVRVSNRPSGDLLIQVGSIYYDSVDAIPPGRTKELLQQAISLWYESQ